MNGVTLAAWNDISNFGDIHILELIIVDTDSDEWDTYFDTKFPGIGIP